MKHMMSVAVSEPKGDERNKGALAELHFMKEY